MIEEKEKDKVEALKTVELVEGGNQDDMNRDNTKS